MKYHGPYHDSSGEQFYLPKEWKKSTMVVVGKRRKKSIIGKNRRSTTNLMTQLIRNLNWLGRTNDLFKKIEIEENDSSSVDEIDEDEEVNEERKKEE